jgi:hypothetical protein
MSVELQPLVEGTNPLFSHFAQVSFGAYDQTEREPFRPDPQVGPFNALLGNLRTYYDATQIGDNGLAATVVERIKANFDPKTRERLVELLEGECKPDSFYRVPDELLPQRPSRETSFLPQLIMGASVIMRGGDEAAERHALTFGHAVGEPHAFQDTPWSPESIEDEKERKDAEITFNNIHNHLNRAVVYTVESLTISPDSRRHLLEAAGIDLEEYGE